MAWLAALTTCALPTLALGMLLAIKHRNLRLIQRALSMHACEAHHACRGARSVSLRLQVYNRLIVMSQASPVENQRDGSYMTGWSDTGLQCVAAAPVLGPLHLAPPAPGTTESALALAEFAGRVSQFPGFKLQVCRLQRAICRL